MPRRCGDDIMAYATTSKLAGLTTFEVERPIAGLPERATASCHKRLTLSVGKRASGSLNAAASRPASSRSAATSSPPAFNVSAPLTQKAAQLHPFVPSLEPRKLETTFGRPCRCTLSALRPWEPT